MTFSRHVIEPKSAPDWYITPILWKSASRVFVDHSIPATRRVPARMGLSPIMCFIIVDLPQPDPPRRMNTSPRFTSNETSRRITAPGYPASTCSSSMMFSAIRCSRGSRDTQECRQRPRSRRFHRPRQRLPPGLRRPRQSSCACQPHSRQARLARRRTRL